MVAPVCAQGQEATGQSRLILGGWGHCCALWAWGLGEVLCTLLIPCLLPKSVLRAPLTVPSGDLSPGFGLRRLTGLLLPIQCPQRSKPWVLQSSAPCCPTQGP